MSSFSTIRISRTLRPARSILQQQQQQRATGQRQRQYPAYVTTGSLPPFRRATATATALFHTTPRRATDRGKDSGAELDKLDLLGGAPAPSHSVDVCMSAGFKLNNGASIEDGSGAILVGGEAFAWRPWLARAGSGEKRLLNGKGQWEVPDESLGLFDLLWPRPDILILGTGPSIRPISPQLRRYIGSLGMRVEVLDTRNAASQFNMLATERGINDIAAALIPIGWKEGVGAR